MRKPDAGDVAMDVGAPYTEEEWDLFLKEGDDDQQDIVLIVLEDAVEYIKNKLNKNAGDH